VKKQEREQERSMNQLLEEVTCHHLSPSVTTRHHLSPSVTICHHLSPSVTICHHLSPSVTICHRILPMLIFALPLLPLLPLTVLGQNLDGQTAVYAGAFAKPVEASCAFCVHSISTPEQFQI